MHLRRWRGDLQLKISKLLFVRLITLGYKSKKRIWLIWRTDVNSPPIKKLRSLESVRLKWFLCYLFQELIGDIPIPEETGTHINQLMRTHLTFINSLHGRSVGSISAVQLDIESNFIAFSGYYHACSIIRVNDAFVPNIGEISIGREIDNSPNVFRLFAFHRDIKCFPDPWMSTYRRIKKSTRSE